MKGNTPFTWKYKLKDRMDCIFIFFHRKQLYYYYLYNSNKRNLNAGIFRNSTTWWHTHNTIYRYYPKITNIKLGADRPFRKAQRSKVKAYHEGVLLNLLNDLG